MDTIFAPICNIGGSIVSIRISGSNAFDFFDCFNISKNIYNNKDLFFTKLNYKDKLVDEVVIKIFREPHSFTGENVIEIDLHGSRMILNEVLNILSTIPNFRFAKNGEFSKRAFLNNKMDLIKCEGINAIIRAETKEQQNLANEMFFGNINNQYKEIRQKLIEAKSFVEMQIDFSEEEVPKNIIDNVKNITKYLIEKLSTCLADKQAIDKINEGIKVAIIGKPNVGKSSLLNWLAKREIAIVSPIAGTTRDVISVDIDLNGYKTTFFDTAGIRESEDLIEKEGIKRAKNVANDSDLCIFLCDDITDIDIIIEESKNYYKSDAILVINKVDLEQNKTINSENYCVDLIKISVLNNINLDILMKKIEEKILNKVELKTNPLVINERHYFSIKKCLDILNNIDFDNMPIEIVGEEINEVINEIGHITGEIYTDDILDNIFSKFCIGK